MKGSVYQYLMASRSILTRIQTTRFIWYGVLANRGLILRIAKNQKTKLENSSRKYIHKIFHTQG